MFSSKKLKIALLIALCIAFVKVERNKTRLKTVPMTEVLPGKPSNFSNLIDKKANVVRLNIFIHGTYGASSAVFNWFKILCDQNIAGSAHEKITRNLWRQRIKAMYNVSLMYNEGLYRINPTAKNLSKEQSSLALFPILKSFAAVSKYTNSIASPGSQIQDLFYVFGWSGLLSQNARREAALALFNAIVAEKNALTDYLKKQNLNQTVEVKLFCHSHGGNVALNLAWIDALINKENPSNIYQQLHKTNASSKIAAKFQTLLCDYSNKNLAESQYFTHKYPMDKWLYEPVLQQNNVNLIDHLYLLATPIQAETWPLAFAKTFGQTTTFYSAGDNIQNLDFLSTDKHKSARLIEPASLRLGNNLFALPNKQKRVVQIQILFDTKTKKQKTLRGCSLRKSKKASHKHKSGPSHLEFWLISWHGRSKKLCTRPLPIVTLVPLLENMCQTTTNTTAESYYMKYVKTPDGLSCNLFDTEETKNPQLSCLLPTKNYQKILSDFSTSKDDLEKKSFLPSDNHLTKIINTAYNWIISWATS